MKLFRHSRAAKWASRWLVPTMIAPLLMYYAPPTTAADAASPASSGDAGRIPAVVVLDFNNLSTYGGALTGRNAAAAVSQAMNESDKWDVLSSTQVTTAVTNLGLTPPLDLTGMQQLGRAVEADAIVLGQVYAVSVTDNPRQAKVGVRVEMRDVASGELINGAISTAQSGVRPGYTGDAGVLVDEAMRKAAFDAVQSMSQNRLPHGTVLNSQVTGSGSREVLLNVGAQNGVREGMEFIVTRAGVQVSRLRVSRVEADQSTAVVIGGTQGAQPEDVVTAIYDLPSVASVTPTVTGEIPAPKAQPRRHKKGFGSALGALIGIGLLVAILSGSNSSGRLSGSNNGQPTAQATSQNQDPQAPFAGSSVRVAWTVPNNVREQDVIQFIITRSDVGNELNPVGIASPGERVFYDTEIGRTLTFSSVGATGTTTGGTNTGGGTLSSVTVTSPGLVPGRPVTYRVLMLYRRPVANQTTGGGANTGTTTGSTSTSTGSTSGTTTSGAAFNYFQTPVATTSAATPFPPPTLASPRTGDTIDNPAAAEFSIVPPNASFNSVTAGPIPIENPTLLNQAMVEFSTDPAFSTVKQVIVPSVSGSQSGQAFTLPPIDLTRLFPGTHGQTIYWHAGMRNVNDSPGPYPGRFANSKGGTDRRWVYSEIESFILP